MRSNIWQIIEWKTERARQLKFYTSMEVPVLCFFMKVRYERWRRKTRFVFTLKKMILTDRLQNSIHQCESVERWQLLLRLVLLQTRGFCCYRRNLSSPSHRSPTCTITSQVLPRFPRLDRTQFNTFWGQRSSGKNVNIKNNCFNIYINW